MTAARGVEDSARPCFEALEARLLMDGTTYVVNSLLDIVAADGVITLREAIEAANTNMAVNEAGAGSDTEADIITFAPSLAGGTITLGGSQFTITGDLLIQGLGSDVLTIDANGQSRAFHISGSGIEVGLADLTITGGSASGHGGGIYSYNANLELADIVLTNNAASGCGGGIYVLGGSSSFTNVEISYNTAGADGGGLYMKSHVAEFSGSTISNNSADSGGGIRVEQISELLLRDSSVLSDNVAYLGGGIYSSNGGMITLVNSSLLRNSARTVGTHFHAYGGGLYHEGSGAVTLTNVEVLGNTATTDGDYSHARGGGIYIATSGEVTFTNVVIVGNTATTVAATVSIANGGGIYMNPGDNDATMINCTVADNSVHDASIAGGSGGGIYSIIGAWILNNTIVAFNSAGTAPDIFGSYTANSSLIGVDPGFVRNPDPGADGVWGTEDDDYGDLRPQEGSAAIDAGDNALLYYDQFDLDGDGDTSEATPIDLVDVIRITQDTVDIGAYERPSPDNDVENPPADDDPADDDTSDDDTSDDDVTDGQGGDHGKGPKNKQPKPKPPRNEAGGHDEGDHKQGPKAEQPKPKGMPSVAKTPPGRAHNRGRRANMQASPIFRTLSLAATNTNVPILGRVVAAIATSNSHPQAAPSYGYTNAAPTPAATPTSETDTIVPAALEQPASTIAMPNIAETPLDILATTPAADISLSSAVTLIDDASNASL